MKRMRLRVFVCMHEFTHTVANTTLTHTGSVHVGAL